MKESDWTGRLLGNEQWNWSLSVCITSHSSSANKMHFMITKNEKKVVLEQLLYLPSKYFPVFSLFAIFLIYIPFCNIVEEYQQIILFNYLKKKVKLYPFYSVAYSIKKGCTCNGHLQRKPTILCIIYSRSFIFS